MTRSITHTLVAVLALLVATPIFAANFTPSLESAEGYTIGNLDGQVGWFDMFPASGGTMDVIASGTDGVTATGGSQLGRATSAVSYRAVHTLTDPISALTSDFTITVNMAYTTVNTDTTQVDGLEILSASNSFNGIRLGFGSQSGVLKFQYRDGNIGTKNLKLLGVDAASPVATTMYKFVVDVHPTTATYDFSVFTLGDTLLGEVSGAGSRSGVSDFSYMAVSLFNAESSSVYFDSAIPEPASMALIGLGGLLMLCRRR